MAKLMRIKDWNVKTFQAIRHSRSTQIVVDRHARRITENANSMASSGTYKWSGQDRKTRYGAIVFTDDYKARVDHRRQGTLYKAM